MSVGFGFQHKVERNVLYRGEEKQITNTVRYPPDTQACIFCVRETGGGELAASADGRPITGEQTRTTALLDAAGESRARSAPRNSRVFSRRDRAAQARYAERPSSTIQLHIVERR